MVGICRWQKPTSPINDIFPPWWDFVMWGICWVTNIIIIMKIIRKTPDELTISMIFSLTSGRLGGYSIWECNEWSNDGGGLPLWGKGDYYYYPDEGEVSWLFLIDTIIVMLMMTLLANLVTDVKGVQIWLRRCGCKHHWLRNHVLQPWCHVSQKR